MKREDAQKLADKALDELAAALEAGQSDTLTKYLTTMALFHTYSWGNVMLIALQKPEATHVAGFATWKKLGRCVKKGEKGIGILAPLVYKQKADDGQSADESAVGEKVVRGFKVVHVFDVAQTDGDELPDFATVRGEPGEHLSRLEALIAEHGITVNDEDIPGGALGVSRGGSIAILPDLDTGQRFAILVHEFCHELLHKSDRRKETTQTIRETEAEAVAFVVCQAIGLESGTASSDYIQLYHGSKDTLAESLHHIQKAAALVLEGLICPK